MEKNFMKSFLIRSLVLLTVIAGAVLLFDPFFQYHKPLRGLKAVLTDKEYQCVGTLGTFDYDSIILGSSVAENNYNAWFNEGFDCNVVKAIRSYGATADLCYLLDIAFENQDLKYVFYSMDTSSLNAEPETTYELTGCPMYLYDKNYLNDIKYLMNKSVLFEKIPYMIAQSTIGDYDENDSYNWAHWKEFNEDMILGLYIRKPSVAPMKEETHYEEQLRGNLDLLTEQIKAHPETQFIIFFPPYSMFFWDNLYRNGELEAYLYNMKEAMEELLDYANVEIHYFQNDIDTISNLELYMDILHFSPEVNYLMYEKLVSGGDRVTEENYEEVIEDMRELSYLIVEEYMPVYEDRIKFDLYDE